MKKIGVITHDSLNPLVGGGALRTLLVARELSKRGNEVILFVPSTTSYLENMPVIHLPQPRKVRSQVLSAIKFNVRLLLRLFKYAKHIDIFFVHNTIAMPAVLFFSFLTNKKIILDITDIHAEYLKVGNPNIIEKIIRPLLLWIEYFMIRKANKVIVVTKTMLEQVVKKGTSRDKVIVVYDGADISKFSSNKNLQSEFNIIHLGTVDKQHGVHYIALAAEKVIKEFPNLHFYIVGDGRELVRVKKIVEEKKLEKYFTFTGYVSHFEVQKYLEKCGIGIIPRPYSLPNNMVITLKLPEYWASGTAVISSRLLGIEEIAKDRENILFFEPDNPNDLAEKIVLLIKNPQLRVSIANGGRESVKKFFWPELINQIVDYALSE